jgi:hypothetical protein
VNEVDGQTLDGPLIDPAIGVVPMEIVEAPVALHVPLVTVTPRTTDPDAPATNVMPGEPCPPVSVAPLMVQLYVAPARAATDALPLPFGQSVAGAVIVASGVAVTFTVFDAVAVQLPFDTVTEYVAVEVGETVIDCVVAPFDQRYDEKPLPASSVTGEPPHEDDGPEIAATGVGVTLTVAGAEVPLQPLELVTVTE